MQIVLSILGTLGLAGTAAVFWRLRTALQSTTLKGAWTWALPGVGLWVTAWLGTVLTPVVTGPLVDQLWYGVAVMMLCPPIAVLGARRPGSRVWGWFVLLPMLLVLALPLLGGWNRDLQVSPLRIEVPALVGYALVLVMGMGNYLGTRLTGASLLYALALLLLVAPLSAMAPAALPEAARCRIGATVALGASAVWGARQAGRPVAVTSRFDRLWIDFLDYFGIVWARRIQERVNKAARTEQWPVRLELYGFTWNGADPDDLGAATNGRIEQTLRWLLRRFVDPDWIDQRLTAPETTGSPPRDTGAGPSGKPAQR